MGAPFTPAALSELKAWYRVENAVLSTTEVTSLPDALGGAALVRNMSAPGPQQGTTANGLKTLVFTAAEALAAASANAAWQNASWFGMCFWFKASQETAQGDFFSYFGGSTGLAANRINCRTQGSTRMGMIVRNEADNGNRLNESNAAGATQTIFKTGVWTHVAWEFDGREVDEPSRNRMYVNAGPLPLPSASAYSDLVGTPGTGIAALRTATAAPSLITLGCRRVDQATSAVSGGIRGSIGPDIMFYDPSMGLPRLRRIMTWRIPRG